MATTSAARQKPFTILFPCVGRRVGLVRYFRRACESLGRPVRIIGTDITPLSPAWHCCDQQYLVPPLTDRGYARGVMAIVEQEGVELLVPTIDPDLPIWARRRKSLADLGCRALVSSPGVVATCLDKRKTYTFLNDHGFDTPATFTAEELLTHRRLRYPYVLKPWDGHAGKHTALAHNRRELRFHAERIPNALAQEQLTGQEYTLDVFVDVGMRVRCAVPRRRIEVRSGEVSKALTVRHEGMIAESQRLVTALKAGPGVITVQCFITEEKELRFLEINPRFGGGAPLAIEAGADFPRWIVQECLGESPEIVPESWQEGLAMLRYDEAVWVDTRGPLSESAGQ